MTAPEDPREQIRQALSDALKPFLFDATDSERLFHAIRKATEPFFADLPEPDYLTVEIDLERTNEELGIIGIKMRVDPERAPPHALDLWNRVMPQRQEDCQHPLVRPVGQQDGRMVLECDDCEARLIDRAL